MSTPFSIDQYCSEPQKFKYLDDYSIKYYDHLCQLRKEAKDKEAGSKGIPAPIEGIYNVLNGFLSPQSLGILSAIMGVKLTQEWAYTQVKNILTLNLSGAKTEFIASCTKAAELFGIEISETIFEETVIATVFTYLFTGLQTLVAPILAVANVGISILDFLMWPLLLLQVIGAVFYAIYTCDLKSELSRDALIKISTQFDDAFRNTALDKFSTITDTFGREITVQKWPLEYYSDSLFQQNYSEYQDKIFVYMYLYLNNQVIDSNGYPIDRTNMKKGFITANQFDIAASNFSSALADNNVVVSNFINKWYPIIFILIILFILFIFLLK